MMMKSQTEEKLNDVFRWLSDEGYVHPDLNVTRDDYNRFRSELVPNITVPDTTITPIMERFLYSVGSDSSVKNIVIFGSYYGYALFWLLGYGLQDEERKIYGIDVDDMACSGARDNFRRVSNIFNSKAECVIYNNNALSDTLAFPDESIDLCFLDIEVNGSKKEYIQLLETWERKLKDGCIILAHDPAVEKFKADFQEFHHYIKSKEIYTPYITLPLDFCGIDIFKKQA